MLFRSSIVLVTHDTEQARRLADYVVRIEAGRIAAQGSAAEVLGDSVQHEAGGASPSAAAPPRMSAAAEDPS